MSKRNKLSSAEQQTILELIETTIPFVQKVVALMGQENYAKFIRIIKAWKRRLALYYTDVRNYDGKYSAIFLDNVIALIEEYHELANARYGEIIKKHPELITRMNAGTQSLVVSSIVEPAIEVVPVEYQELSQSNVFEARDKAVEIAVTKQSWKPKGEESRGAIFISQVYFMLDAIEYATHYYRKALLYHAKRLAQREKFPKYWQNYVNYKLSIGELPVAFEVKLTLEEKIIEELEKKYPKAVYYKSLAKKFEMKEQRILHTLARMLAHRKILKLKKGYYLFNAPEKKNSLEKKEKKEEK